MEKDARGKLNHISVDFYPILLIILSFVLHLGWMYFTNYTEEDAFITFRVAQNIASGNGFVYNNGEPLYGSTTPLLALLLSLWIKFISSDVVFAARILNICTVVLTLLFTWQALKILNLSVTQQVCALLALLTSSKLIDMNTQGMEIPLGLCFLSASWYFWLKGKFNLAGLMCGLLLWVRIDFAFWVLILVMFTTLKNLKDALRVALIASAVYLPWVIFAFLYFGSPIPFTATAKWFAYNQFNPYPYSVHFSVVLEYLSPYRGEGKVSLWGTAIAIILAVWGLRTNRTESRNGLILIVVFIVFEIARLAFTGTTYFNRYFIPILWATMILFGIGLGALWERIKNMRFLQRLFLVFVSVLFVLQLQTSFEFATRLRNLQIYRHEQSLKAIGLWLKNNTDPNSIILLEPLGYVGYYSERKMLDEVGLVTPAVVELKRQKISAEQYASLFQPDYVIIHCNDTIQIPSASEPDLKYSLAITFNPLNYDENIPIVPLLSWLSCYEIWKKE